MQNPIIGLALTAGLALGITSVGATPARAQAPGESVVYETVAPATRSVTRGEQTIVKQRFRKTIIKERPVRYITRTPAVVRETRYFQPAPVVENVVVQPAPIIESRVVQPAPIVESRYIQRDPVVRTRYLPPFPY